MNRNPHLLTGFLGGAGGGGGGGGSVYSAYLLSAACVKIDS